MEKTSIYTALVSDRSTRLLHISPGNYTEEIQCSLETVSLDEHDGHYEALSYVWGNTEPAQYIVLNGIRKAVTPNLYLALRRIRQPDRSVTFWIDALCVNQDDIDERSQQVQLMRDVYYHAKSTVLWLGEEDENTNIGIELINLGGLQWEKDYGPITGAMDQRLVEAMESGPLRVSFDINQNQALGFPAPEDPAWSIVVKILSNPWFERMWIIQEVAMSKLPILVIGIHQLEWDVIRAAVAWWFRKDYISTIPAELLGKPVQIGLCKSEKGMPLLQLLFYGKKFQATDPRDKIFALYGLALESRQEIPCPLLVPDYTKSAFDVHLDVIRHELECHHPRFVATLDVLNHVHHWSQFEYANTSKVPTWMPRWDNDNTMFRMSGSFRASGTLPVTLQCPVTKAEIILKGVNIGVVDSTSDALWRLWVKQLWEPKLVWAVISELYLGYVLFKQNHSQKSEFLRNFVHAITMGGSMERRAPTEADFLAYCAENLTDSLRSIPMAESTHPNESNAVLNQYKVQPLLGRSSSRSTEGGIGDKVRFQIQHCSLFTTAEYMGMGHFTMLPGDIICILFGGKTPYVLRPTDGHYAFVGECYVSGLMDGEAMDQIETGKLKEEWFNLR